MSTIEHVNLPLTGAGQSTVKVAVDNTPDGVIQLFKIVHSADGVSTLVPADVDGLFVQSIDRVENPQDDLLVATNLSPGGNTDLNAADIATGKTGRLLAVDVGSSVPIRCDIQLVNGSRVTRTSIYSITGETFPWKVPAPAFFELAGGTGKHFGVSVTNLSPYKAADIRATLYWDEV
jgi:hypothetical protein